MGGSADAGENGDALTIVVAMGLMGLRAVTMMTRILMMVSMTAVAGMIIVVRMSRHQLRQAHGQHPRTVKLASPAGLP